MKRRKAIVFKGYDWSELAQLKHVAGKQWPTVADDLDEDDRNAYCIKEYLSSLIMNDERVRERQVACGYVRKFCLALGKCKHDYSSPVYVAIAKIKNDDTLLAWVIRNLECMWN